MIKTLTNLFKQDKEKEAEAEKKKKGQAPKSKGS